MRIDCTDQRLSVFRLLPLRVSDYPARYTTSQQLFAIIISVLGLAGKINHRVT
jgi:hypothetical protein